MENYIAGIIMVTLGLSMAISSIAMLAKSWIEYPPEDPLEVAQFLILGVFFGSAGLLMSAMGIAIFLGLQL